jgi:nucleotide-binding universal stress UspA family protein
MTNIKRILVPVDFSPCSMSALRYACQLGELLGATIDVVHVWAAPSYIGPHMALEATEGPGPTLWQYARVGAARDMEQFIADFQRSCPVKIRMRLERGDPCDTILSMAKDGRFDLIVMGTHGRRAMSPLSMGSVAQNVVRGSHCPVLAVPSVEHSPIHEPI